MIRRLLIGPVIVALAACSATPSRPLGVASDDEGLVIVSITVSGNTLAAATAFEYHLRRTDTTSELPVLRNRNFSSARQHARWVSEQGRASTRTTRLVIKSDTGIEAPQIVESGKPVGRVFALHLPPGEYEIFDWKLVLPGKHGMEILRPQQQASYRFAVGAGQASYIGSLGLRLDESRSYDANAINAMERDLALLAGNDPSLATAAVSYRPGQWR